MAKTIPETMHAVLLTGHGGFERLEYRDDVPVPLPADGQVLVRVAAAGINNTDINTRIGWYSKTVDGATDSGASDGFESDVNDDGSWSGVPLVFPRVQGADACGRIVAVGNGVDPGRAGERVLIRALQPRPTADNPVACWTFGSECDGAFAQYTVTGNDEAYRIESGLSDAELASFPCAYSTAENMLHRAGVGRGDRIYVTGASGGVGSAAVQLARRRGARVIASCSRAKSEQVRALGADEVLDRGRDPLQALGRDSVDTVIDLVAGPMWSALPDLLRPGGKYVTAGAIAGPIVDFDVRTLYLKDLTFYGCTYQDPQVFGNLVGYIERGEIKPLLSKVYPLSEIVAAQQDFLDKKFTGKLVLEIPQQV
jgi:NADPH:quinone reductase-like Zn-dependent oxidoreductase